MTASADTTSGVRIERRSEDVSAVVLARPERMNALHGPSIAALDAALAALAEDPATRSVILTGDGPHFSSGGDLDWMRARDAAALDAEAMTLATRLARLPRGAFERTKWLFERTAGALDALLEDERAAQAACLGSGEFEEGVAAFLARRAPEFR